MLVFVFTICILYCIIMVMKNFLTDLITHFKLNPRVPLRQMDYLGCFNINVSNYCCETLSYIPIYLVVINLLECLFKVVNNIINIFSTSRNSD